MLTEQERTEISSLRFMNTIDEQLRAVVEFVHKGFDEGNGGNETVEMVMFLYYNNEPLTRLSFDFHNYDFDELQNIGKNIRKNEFIMHELDMALATYGD